MARLSKREKRLAVQAAKQLAHLEKKARQLAAPEPEKEAKEAVAVAPIKSPREPLHLSERSKTTMTWCRDDEDRAGTWSWGIARDWGDEIWGATLHPFLRDCQQKTWGHLEAESYNKGKRHKTYPIEAIRREAQIRLRELSLDDQTSIFRFRMGGKPRLYGFIFGATFHTVWYDPTHDVCPSNVQDRDHPRKRQRRRR